MFNEPHGILLVNQITFVKGAVAVFTTSATVLLIRLSTSPLDLDQRSHLIELFIVHLCFLRGISLGHGRDIDTAPIRRDEQLRPAVLPPGAIFHISVHCPVEPDLLRQLPIASLKNRLTVFSALTGRHTGDKIAQYPRLRFFSGDSIWE
jgi:hypothetical protein